ncbi:MAG: glycoside hydrolase family 92 protein [Muribaculaceae bacterium]|nr:glycoside hydrolase family 92 protein [Muribaculaceae bacterium]
MSDVNGDFRAHDGTIKKMHDNGNYYSTFSLWDTYRALNPLLSVLYPELVCDMVNSMLEMYDSSGELPVWPLASGETGCMIGYHSVSVIADAFLKGYRCFDPHHALEAMVVSSNKPRKATDVWGSEGYIPCDRYKESVSCSLENSYDDWCIARLAEAIGNDSIASIYYERAGNYANLFDTSTRFFRGHKADGNWASPFIPAAVSGDYTEPPRGSIALLRSMT